MAWNAAVLWQRHGAPRSPAPEFIREEVMPFDRSQTAAIRNWVNRQHGGPLLCSLCGQRDWSTWSIQAARFRFDPPHRPISDADELIILVCQRCGHIVPLDPTIVRLPPATPS
jgi:hypothetical protein